VAGFYAALQRLTPGNCGDYRAASARSIFFQTSAMGSLKTFSAWWFKVFLTEKLD
jgi:hypothetical protein